MIKNFLYLILLCSINIFGQSPDVEKLFEPTETDSLYIIVIENYSRQLDTLNTNDKRIDSNSKVIYIEYENYLMRIPKMINGYQIIKLGLANRKKYFRKNKNHLSLVQILPLRLKDGIFSIRLTPYSARLKGKRKMELGYSHRNTSYFKFIDGKLVFDKIESGRI